jgi:restriction system protein
MLAVVIASVVGQGTVAHDALRALTSGLVDLWWLWALLGAAGATKVWLWLRRERRLARSGIAEVDRMDGRTFEEFLAGLFRARGYRVELTAFSGDYGADLVIAKGGLRRAVQAKRHSRPVGIRAVQEVVGAVRHYGCQEALVVANRDFTPAARRLARDNGVELWDRARLVQELLTARGGPSPAPAELGTPPLPLEVPVPPASTETCATCGAAVPGKVRDYCAARRDRFEGLVYCYKHQRAARSPVLPGG